MKNSASVGCRVPTWVRDRLTEIARGRRVTVSRIILEAIYYHIMQEGTNGE